MAAWRDTTLDAYVNNGAELNRAWRDTTLDAYVNNGAELNRAWRDVSLDGYVFNVTLRLAALELTASPSTLDLTAWERPYGRLTWTQNPATLALDAWAPPIPPKPSLTWTQNPATITLDADATPIPNITATWNAHPGMSFTAWNDPRFAATKDWTGGGKFTATTQPRQYGATKGWTGGGKFTAKGVGIYASASWEMDASRTQLRLNANYHQYATVTWDGGAPSSWRANSPVRATATWGGSGTDGGVSFAPRVWPMPRYWVALKIPAGTFPRHMDEYPTRIDPDILPDWWFDGLTATGSEANVRAYAIDFTELPVDVWGYRGHGKRAGISDIWVKMNINADADTVIYLGAARDPRPDGPDGTFGYRNVWRFDYVFVWPTGNFNGDGDNRTGRGWKFDGVRYGGDGEPGVYTFQGRMWAEGTPKNWTWSGALGAHRLRHYNQSALNGAPRWGYEDWAAVYIESRDDTLRFVLRVGHQLYYIWPSGKQIIGEVPEVLGPEVELGRTYTVAFTMEQYEGEGSGMATLWVDGEKYGTMLASGRLGHAWVNLASTLADDARWVPHETSPMPDYLIYAHHRMYSDLWELIPLPPPDVPGIVATLVVPADRVSEHLPDFPVYVPFHKLPSLNPNPNSYLTFPPAPMELDPTNGVAFFRMKLDPVTDNHVFLIHDPAAPPMPSGHPDLPAQVWADYAGAFHFNAGLKLANSAGGPAFIATDQGPTFTHGGIAGGRVELTPDTPLTASAPQAYVALGGFMMQVATRGADALIGSFQRNGQDVAHLRLDKDGRFVLEALTGGIPQMTLTSTKPVNDGNLHVVTLQYTLGGRTLPDHSQGRAYNDPEWNRQALHPPGTSVPPASDQWQLWVDGVRDTRVATPGQIVYDAFGLAASITPDANSPDERCVDWYVWFTGTVDEYWVFAGGEINQVMSNAYVRALHESITTDDFVIVNT